MAATSPRFSIAGPAVERKLHVQFVGQNLGESGLAEARRAEQQDVIECLFALPRRLDRDRQVLLDLLLPDEFLQDPRTKMVLESNLIFPIDGIHQAIVFFHATRYPEICFRDFLSKSSNGASSVPVPARGRLPFRRCFGRNQG